MKHGADIDRDFYEAEDSVQQGCEQLVQAISHQEPRFLCVNTINNYNEA